MIKYIILIHPDGLCLYIHCIELCQYLYFKFGRTKEEFEASMYVRIFGNEVKYINSRDLGLDTVNMRNPSNDASRTLREFIRTGEVSYTYSNNFLDSSLIVPTMIGLPLNLTLNATVSTDVKVTGNVDLAQPNSRFLLEANVQPRFVQHHNKHVYI